MSVETAPITENQSRLSQNREAKVRDVFGTTFKQGSIAEISDLFQKLAEDTRAKNSVGKRYFSFSI